MKPFRAAIVTKNHGHIPKINKYKTELDFITVIICALVIGKYVPSMWTDITNMHTYKTYEEGNVSEIHHSRQGKNLVLQKWDGTGMLVRN